MPALLEYAWEREVVEEEEEEEEEKENSVL